MSHRITKPLRENTHCKQEADAKKFLRRKLGQIAVGRFTSPRVEKVTVNDLAEDIRNDYYYTGWRKSEILSLQWKQVDLDNRIVKLDPGTTKSGEGRTVVLEGELLELIQQQRQRRAVAEIPSQSPGANLCVCVPPARQAYQRLL